MFLFSADDSVIENGDLLHDESILVVRESTVADSQNRLTNHVVVDVVPSAVSTNHIEDKFYSDINGPVNGSNGLIGGDRGYRSPTMKNRSLSPASESFAQNNAFNSDNNSVLKDRYTTQGAKPKVRNAAQSGSSNDIAIATANVEDFSVPCANTSSKNGVYIRTSLHNEVECIMKEEDENRWADLANPGIKFIDEESPSLRTEGLNENVSGLICDSSQLTPTLSDNQKRLYLGSQISLDMEAEDSCRSCDERRRSLTSDATDEDSCTEFFGSHDNVMDSDVLSNITNSLPRHSIDIGTYSEVVNRDSFTRKNSGIEISQSASLPASPLKRNLHLDSPTHTLREEVLKAKCKHYSPIFKRRSKYARDDDNSENDFTVEEMRFHHHYKNLESFQKAQLKQKVKALDKKIS